jgi:hypothetical protein
MKLKSIFLAALFPVLLSGCATPATATTKVRPYSKKVCLVSNNTLDSMGDTITEVYNGQEVKFCCEPCVKKVHAQPEKNLPKLQ